MLCSELSYSVSAPTYHPQYDSLSITTKHCLCNISSCSLVQDTFMISTVLSILNIRLSKTVIRRFNPQYLIGRSECTHNNAIVDIGYRYGIYHWVF